MQGHVSTCVVVTCMYTFGSRKYVQSRQPKTQDERGRCARHGSKTTALNIIVVGWENCANRASIQATAL